MGDQEQMKGGITAKAIAFPKYRKERFLLSMSQEDFREKVIRPVLLRQGLKEAQGIILSPGEDLLPAFVAKDQLGMEDIYVVVAFKGNLNLSKMTEANQCVANIERALTSKIPVPSSKKKKEASKVILFASGKINDSIKACLNEKVKDSRLVFFDSDELIKAVDAIFPEVWLGIETDVIPYFRAIRTSLEDATENLGISDVLPAGTIPSVVTDRMFVPLRLFRTAVRLKRRRGKVIQVPEIQEMPLTGILNKPERRILILGEAGSGKSTSIKRLAYVLADRGLEVGGEPKIPVLLRAIDLRTQSSSLRETCEGIVSELTASSRGSLNEDELTKGNVVAFIDALDELADDESRRFVLRKIGDFHRQYPLCQVIVTSRNSPFVTGLTELREYSDYNLAGINFKQAEQIIVRLQRAKNLPAEKAKEILRRIQEVHGIELNPLLVTVFAATTEYSRKDIPANITELFKKYTEMMLGRWDAAKGLAQQYHAPLKDFLLKKMAFDMHKNKATYMRIEKFRLFISTELEIRGHKPDTEQIVDEILNRSGLFRILGNTLEFRHFLLQEFFAGRGIPSNTLLETLITDEWWQRAIVFYFGENPGDSNGLLELVKSLPSKSKNALYRASTTLGLALQACYLVEVKHKTTILQAVINGLSDSRDEYLLSVGNEDRFPLNRFLGYYLFGRDSVACSFIRDRYDSLDKDLSTISQGQEERDIRKFWLIVGLIESGSVDIAAELTRKFRPSDSRLLLGIYLGCALIQHLRMTSTEERKAASQIMSYLSEIIEPLRQQVLVELRTELLEIRQGKIKTIEA